MEYKDKYLEDVKNLLIEIEEYIVSLDKDSLDRIFSKYREKMATLNLDEAKKKIKQLA